MGERKVVNKYYPPDFDPAKIPKSQRNQQIKVRTMLPMSIRCRTCGNYMYKGTKFNVRKEDVIGETYLGIKIFRFYYKCTKCSAEITIKTDPQSSDYVVESGAARNFEPWRAEDDAQSKRDAEEKGDPMKSLENRTRDSKREMDILSAIEETKSLKARHAAVSQDLLFKALQPSAPIQEDKLEEEDEALIKSIFHGSKESMRRIHDDELKDGVESSQVSKKRKTTAINYSTKTSKKSVVVKKTSSEEKAKIQTGSGLKLVCQQYDED